MRNYTREIRPLGDWHRHYPEANAIAGALLKRPDLLRLRTRLLVRDIRDQFDVSESTAMKAVSIARHEIGAMQ